MRKKEGKKETKKQRNKEEDIMIRRKWKQKEKSGNHLEKDMKKTEAEIGSRMNIEGTEKESCWLRNEREKKEWKIQRWNNKRDRRKNGTERGAVG